MPTSQVRVVVNEECGDRLTYELCYMPEVDHWGGGRCSCAPTAAAHRGSALRYTDADSIGPVEDGESVASHSDRARCRCDEDMALRLGNGIKRVEQLLMGEKARVLRGFGLTVPQYATLAALAQTPGRSAAQLARAALVSPQTMATILGNLEAKGLVKRDASSLHVRVLVCRLTEAGGELVSHADRMVKPIEDGLRSVFTEDEFRRFREYLARSEQYLLARVEA